MDKKDILKNVQDYSADQLSEWIRQNVVTLDELRATGKLLMITERRLKGILAKSPASTLSAVNEEKEQPSSGTSSASQPDYDEEEFTYSYDEEDYSSNSSNVSTASAASTLSKSENTSTVSESISNKGMFKRPFSLKGRIRRTEYGLSQILYFALVVILQIIMESTARSDNSAAPFLIMCFLILYVMLWWFMIAQGAKRCHDLGHSGWYQLIPFYGLLMLFWNGDKGTNEYGDNPKGE